MTVQLRKIGCLQSAGPDLHFAHANGLPFATYASFLSAFAGDYRICGFDTRGAWPEQPDPPGDFTWNDHVKDLVASLTSHYSGPVIGMGHSLGGSLSLLAAIKRPDLFRALVLIDPATAPNRIVAGIFNQLPKRLTGRIDWIKRTARRRRTWDSRESFMAHQRTRRAYQRFTDDAMTDYADGGLRPTKDGKFELVYNPAWEAHNFQTTPCIWPALSRISIPTLLLKPEHTYMYPARLIERKARRFPGNVNLQVLENQYHLAPQEDPDTTATVIRAWLSRLDD